MENENWNCSNFGMEIPTSDLNCSSEQLSNSFFNPSWENSMDQNDPFESALSSMVSSPVASNVAGDNVVLRELIGRLGSICNSGEISPHSYIGKSTENSCYSTPLNSPPKTHHWSSMMDHQPRINGSFPPFSVDPGFVERAARNSSFAGSRVGISGCHPNIQLFGQNEIEFPSKLSRASSFQSRETKDGNSISNNKNINTLPPDTGELGEESSVSEQIPAGLEMGLKPQNDDNNNGRKRKAIPRGKARDIPPSPSPSTTNKATKGETNPKRSKSEEDNGNEERAKAKAEEPFKDYIHVRARRGQATDSHSLAERVRREKISERMKFLQDLVPGCNKVTGKAVMLDEIINYVQSLQRQVEFLSMKLSTVNPRPELTTDAILSKDIFQSCTSLPPTMFSDPSLSALHYQYQSQSVVSNGTESPYSMNPHNAVLRRSQSMLPQQPPVDRFNETSSQVLHFWEDDLHNVVQMGFGENQTESFNGARGAEMKTEV